MITSGDRVRCPPTRMNPSKKIFRGFRFLIKAKSIEELFFLLMTAWFIRTLFANHQGTFDTDITTAWSVDVLHFNQTKKYRVPIQSKAGRKKEIPTALAFVDSEKLERTHIFSDSFWLSKTRFLEVDIPKIRYIEDAALNAAWPGAAGNRSAFLPHAKMMQDWTDFSVEHLSKWWGMVGVSSHLYGTAEDEPLSTVISVLENYIKRQLLSPPSPHSVNFQTTISIIPFLPYVSEDLTVYSLAATLIPLIKVGFGRVVVVSMNDSDQEYAKKACAILNSLVEALDNGDTGVSSIKMIPKDDNRIHDNTISLATMEFYHPNNSNEKKKIAMEVSHVRIEGTETLKDRAGQWNIPKGAVAGLQLALKGELRPDEQVQWLGRKPDWKYVYLTEADTILNVNHDLMPLFRKALDKGISLFPHRLHPLPHESDLPSNSRVNRGLYLPAVPPFDKVVTLDASGNEYIACCDNGLYAPGKENWYGMKKHKNGECAGKRWWECGFYRHNDIIHGEFDPAKAAQGHPRLQAYELKRLRDGVGLVFGSSNHGRTCTPSKIRCDLQETV